MSTRGVGAAPDWRTEGVRVIPGDALDSNTPQTPGMNRAAAVTRDRGSEKLWAGTVTIHPGARTGAHHHGELESVIYVIRGRARMRWGENLEFAAEAGPARAGSFSCRHSCRTRRLTPWTRNRSNAW